MLCRSATSASALGNTVVRRPICRGLPTGSLHARSDKGGCDKGRWRCRKQHQHTFSDMPDRPRSPTNSRFVTRTAGFEPRTDSHRFVQIRSSCRFESTTTRFGPRTDSHRFVQIRASCRFAPRTDSHRFVQIRSSCRFVTRTAGFDPRTDSHRFVQIRSSYRVGPRTDGHRFVQIRSSYRFGLRASTRIRL